MKKNLLKKLGLLTVASTLLLATGCGAGTTKIEDSVADSTQSEPAVGDTQVVTVAVVGEAQEMWVPVIEELKKEGIEVKLQTFSDYHTPNEALANGEVDLNAHQHHAFLKSEIDSYNYDLVAIGDTFISTMNLYSNNHESVDEIPDGGKIAIPNDPSNEGRALKVLQASGLIKLAADPGDEIDLADVEENSKNIEFVETEAANITSLLPDLDAAVINCNFALDFGLNPGEDAIFLDNVDIYDDDSYFNLIAAKKENENNETYKKVVEAYQSEAVKEVYKTAFKGAYLPTWEK
ncbi:MAG: MetQ/NlpA family ABC transporter substrate-binding protein [Eubacteriales bacterium]|nr:MetQ/NlpA family ABC transporter substrate-binding protein [Eubacteriales bacterium]